MHMRITPLDSPAEHAAAELKQHSGLVSAYALRPMDQQQPVLVSVWETAAYADQAAVTAGGRKYDDTRFQDCDTTDAPPSYAQLVYFDGSRSQAEADAIERANNERIAPAVRAIPGNLGAYVGRAHDGSFAVLSLTTSLQAVEDSQRAIMSTALLPGEDPALLTGPQRIQLAWVLSAFPATSVAV